MKIELTVQVECGDDGRCGGCPFLQMTLGISWRYACKMLGDVEVDEDRKPLRNARCLDVARVVASEGGAT